MKMLALLAMVLMSANQPPPDHAPLDRILSECVRGGRVDYLLVRKKHWDDLRGYLDAMGDVDDRALPTDQRLALYCNLYNATMIRTVVERFHAEYDCAENNKQIFRDSLVRVKGRTITLDELEHKLIRGEFDEPRIHAALVCGGMGCPAHPAHAYFGHNLRQVLDDDMRRWVNDPSRNRIDPVAGTAVISRLFRSYASDFGGIEAVKRFVDEYHPADLSQLNVTFDEHYDWSLNIAPPAQGRWVRVTAEQAALLDAPGGQRVRSAFRHAVFEVLEEADGHLKIDRAFGQGVAWINAADTAPFVVKVNDEPR